MSWRVVLDYDGPTDTDRLLIVREGPNSRQLVMPWVVQDWPRMTPAEPTYNFEGWSPKPLLQAFADLAWERGVRPSQIEDQRNQVTAMTAHLEDLRKIAFKTLKVQTS